MRGSEGGEEDVLRIDENRLLGARPGVRKTEFRNSLYVIIEELLLEKY